jgi:hypothetical protein
MATPVPILAFTPAAYLAFAATAAGNTVAIPAGGVGTVTALITNLGAAPAAVLLGTGTLAPTQANGTVIMPGHQLALAVGAATSIAAIALGFGSASLNVAFGV